MMEGLQVILRCMNGSGSPPGQESDHALRQSRNETVATHIVKEDGEPAEFVEQHGSNHAAENIVARISKSWRLMMAT